MADPEHRHRLRQGVEKWNHWRQQNPDIIPNLRAINLRQANLGGANLQGADLGRAQLRQANLGGANLAGVDFGGAKLRGANLAGAKLSGVNFRDANLGEANLSYAKLSGAKLSQLKLSGADLGGADLAGADLREADLIETDLRRVDFSGADVTGASFARTRFGDTNLSGVVGLESCRHYAPSYLDYHTLTRSGPLPLFFVRGCGLSDLFIDYIPALLNQPIQFYSCFISYSTTDQDFAERLHADLQNKGVRCWFAPHQIQGGKKLHEQIDEAIRFYERLLLILSEASMNSEWVRTEIAKARKRELSEKRRMLFPVRLVDFETIREWECFDADTGKDSAREIREYFVPDFSNWKDHDAYTTAFRRLLQDLKLPDRSLRTIA